MRQQEAANIIDANQKKGLTKNAILSNNLHHTITNVTLRYG